MQNKTSDKVKQGELMRALHLGWVVTTQSLDFYGKFAQQKIPKDSPSESSPVTLESIEK